MFTALTPSGLLGKTFKILVRAGSSSEGNQKLFDQKFSVISAFNKGSLDKVMISDTQLTLGGWHACNDIKTKTGHLLILMENGASEILRLDVTNNVVKRNDVQKALELQAYGAENSGFLATMTIPARLKGKKVKVLSKRIGGPNSSANYMYSKEITL